MLYPQGRLLVNNMEADPSENVKDSIPLAEANEIYRKLEERAIAESNDLNYRIAHCRKCERGEFLPTVGSGHPLADIFLLHSVEPEEGEKKCASYWLEEFHITQPRLIVVMGRETLAIVNAERIAGMKELVWDPGALQDFTPFCKALVTPDIDVSLDDEHAKSEFWKAFRNVGEWFRDEPPY